MRQIEIPKGTRRDVVGAMHTIMWATVRRGNTPWKAANVVGAINRYCSRHGVHLESRRIGYVLERFEAMGYAERKMGPGGKTTIEFRFKPDVVITGFSPPETTKPATNGHTPDVELPLPALPHARYLAGDLDTLLDLYAETDSDGYAAYAEKLKAALERLLGTED